MDNLFIKNILQNFKTCKECNETKDKYHFEQASIRFRQRPRIHQKMITHLLIATTVLNIPLIITYKFVVFQTNVNYCTIEL